MSFSSQTCETTFTGNNSDSTPYAIPWAFVDPDHVVVSVIDDGGTETTLDEGDDYVLTPTASGNIYSGGSLVTEVAYDNTNTVKVRRVTPAIQATTFPTGGQFPAASLESALDRAVMVIAELRRDVEALEARVADLE